MAQPTPFERTGSVDQAIGDIALTLRETLANLALLQRDDTAVRNKTVHPDALSTATLALIASSWTPQGLWVTSTAYAVGDVVETASTSYVCAEAHASGTFADDHDAGKWVVLGTPFSLIGGDIQTSAYEWIASTNLQDALEEIVDDLAASSGASRIGVIQSGTGATARTVQAKARDIVSLQDFGGVGDDSTSNNTALTNALATGAVIYAPAGTYKISSAVFLTLLSGGGIIGDGPDATIFKLYGYTTKSQATFDPTSSFLTAAGNNVFRDFSIRCGDTFDYSKTYESWTAYNYTANNHIIGINLGSNTLIDNVYFERLYLGTYADTKSKIRATNCSTYQTAYSSLIFYNSSDIVVTGGSFRVCGSAGGLLFSSCTDWTASNNHLLNPESSGINSGGALTANAKRIAITGNSILAGDSISCENGAEKLTITGNECSIAGNYVSNFNLTGINVQMNNAPTGAVNTVVISGNSVCMLNTNLTYKDFLGSLIDVGGVVGGLASDDLTISGNTVRGGETGIHVHGAVGTVNSNLAITGNNCTHNFYGLKLETTSAGFVGSNVFSCGKATTTAGTYGIYMLSGAITDVTFSANQTIGYEYHLQQDVPGSATNLNCTRSVVQSHTFSANPGDSGAYTEYRNSGSGTDLNLRPLERFQQGIATANNLVLGTRGTKFAMTGATQINLIDNTGWINGDVVQLHAQGGATTVKNAQASAGNNKTIVTSTGADWVSGAAGLGVLTLIYDSAIPGWREVARVG